MKKICFIIFMLFSTDVHAERDICSKNLAAGAYLKYLTCVGTNDDLISVHNRSVALSFLGDELGAQKLFSKIDAREFVSSIRTTTGSARAEKETLYTRFNAVEELARQSERHQIVMLNEAHHISLHRVFALQLATALRKRGFTHLAVEGLTEATATERAGHVTLSPMSGFYVADPEFGYFLREAVRLGFGLLSYEAFGTRTIEEREFKQAENIQKFLIGNPKARIFVFAGYGHIREHDSPASPGRMAKILRQLTGIDALTVDQVGGTENPYNQLNDPVYSKIHNQIGTYPSIFKKSNAEWLVSADFGGSVDVTVFHPSDRYMDDRPSWLSHGRGKHTVSEIYLPSDGQAVVRATVAAEPNGVPTDQILIGGKSKKAVLYLPYGRYVIEIETLAGVKKLYNLDVE